MFEQKTKDQPA